MDELFEEQHPEYYDIIPEFNSAGRLCNYHTGPGETVRVMAGEWERFNQLAGRQHEIVNGIVVYNETLEPCMPDEPLPAETEENKKIKMFEAQIQALSDRNEFMEDCFAEMAIMLFDLYVQNN